MSIQQPAIDRAPLRARFKEIDWSFPNSVSDPVHSVHPYPARFIPEIPAAALDLLPAAGMVIDPFSGIGTTVIESARRGRDALGIDLNPVGTLVAQAKLSGWTASDAPMVGIHSEGVHRAILRGSTPQLEIARASIPRVDHWFELDVQRSVAGAVAYIETLDEGDPWRIRLRAALSSILVKVSRQESDTRYAAVSKGTTPQDVVAAMHGAIQRVARAAFALANQMPNGVQASVITGNAADVEEHVAAGSVAGAIFSPPYPNAYEYWLYHKYRMYWLGFDPLAVRGAEIGARPFYSGSGTHTEEDFGLEMQCVFGGLTRVLRDDGLVIVVVGDSRIRGRDVDNRAVLIEAADGCGLKFLAGTKRIIRRTRRSFNLAIARARDEHVLLFGQP